MATVDHQKLATLAEHSLNIYVQCLVQLMLASGLYHSHMSLFKNIKYLSVIKRILI